MRLYAITNGIGYYVVALDTGRPTFLAKPFAYTYNTRQEAEDIANKLRKIGFAALVINY